MEPKLYRRNAIRWDALQFRSVYTCGSPSGQGNAILQHHRRMSSQSVRLLPCRGVHRESANVSRRRCRRSPAGRGPLRRSGGAAAAPATSTDGNEAVCGGARVRGGAPLSRAHRLGVWRLLGQGARTLPGGPRRARTAHARRRPDDRGVVVCSAKPASAFRRNGIIDRRRGLGRSCPPTGSLRPTVLPAGRVATRSRRPARSPPRRPRRTPPEKPGSGDGRRQRAVFPPVASTCCIRCL